MPEDVGVLIASLRVVEAAALLILEITPIQHDTAGLQNV